MSNRSLHALSRALLQKNSSEQGSPLAGFVIENPERNLDLTGG
jgi:hypothetical protein